MLKYLYVTEDFARRGGLTHEGWLYGLPVWMGDVENPISFVAVPKIPVGLLYLHFMNFMFQMFANIMDAQVDVPMTVGRDITDDGSTAAV